MAPSDYADILKKLPHREPMRLVDAIVSLEGNAVETTTRLDSERLNYLGNDSQVGAYWGIELIAQSGALPLIASSKDGKPHAGVIVQVQSFSSFVSCIGKTGTITTSCTCDLQLDGSVALICGRVSFEGVLICEASLMLAMREA